MRSYAIDWSMNKIRRVGVHLLYKAFKEYIVGYKRNPVFKPKADKAAKEEVLPKLLVAVEQVEH